MEPERIHEIFQPRIVLPFAPRFHAQLFIRMRGHPEQTRND